MKTFGSLFTGFGLVDIGAIAAGYTPIWGNEIDPEIAAVASMNGLSYLGNPVRSEARVRGGG